MQSILKECHWFSISVVVSLEIILRCICRSTRYTFSAQFERLVTVLVYKKFQFCGSNNLSSDKWTVDKHYLKSFSKKKIETRSRRSCSNRKMKIKLVISNCKLNPTVLNLGSATMICDSKIQLELWNSLPFRSYWYWWNLLH